MAGEDLADARVTFAGLVGDRVYAFVDTENKSDFPWLTARMGSELILFRPRFVKPPAATDELSDAVDYSTEVTTPGGDTFRIDDPQFLQVLEKQFSRSLRLRFSERSMHDSRPISIFGLGTLRGLSEETGMTLDPRRFRANFYVRWDDDLPFFEDKLIGRQLQIGDSTTIQAVKRDSRCVIMTLDPETAAPSPKVLETVYHTHDGCAGIYGAVLREGIVRAGDIVYAL